MSIKLTCYQCGNPKFGMIRHWRLGKVFCKSICRDNYLNGKARTPPKQFEKPYMPSSERWPKNGFDVC
jgi:hypothetical protein